MKAIHHDRFGPLDVLRLADLDSPTPGAGQVLLQVAAAGLNPGDRHAVRGVPYAARLMGYGFRRPRQPVPGRDVAGTVTAVGEGVTRFSVGDEVFGWGSGTLAEFAVAEADDLEPKPPSVTFEQAAAVPTAATAALQGLVDVGRVQPGHRVLVIGASGGVGTFATQIASALGGHVTAVASGRNVDLVRSAGADTVVDYARSDVATLAERFDVILDLVGRLPLGAAARLLSPGGTFVVVGGQNPDSLTGMGRFATAMVLSPVLRRRLRPLFSQPSRSSLAELRQFLDDGRILPVIDSVHDLAGAVDGLRYVETGHSRGKVVVTL